MSDDLTRRIARIIEEGRPIYGDPNEQARRILALVFHEKKNCGTRSAMDKQKAGALPLDYAQTEFR